MHMFVIEWLNWDKRTIAREPIWRRDMTAAIVAAANKLKRARGDARHAYGFHVTGTRTET